MSSVPLFRLAHNLNPNPNLGAFSALRDYVGQTAILRSGPLRIAVRCIDARTVYRRVDVLVTPVTGEGEQWVSAERLTFPQ